MRRRKVTEFHVKYDPNRKTRWAMLTPAAGQGEMTAPAPINPEPVFQEPKRPDQSFLDMVRREAEVLMAEEPDLSMAIPAPVPAQPQAQAQALFPEEPTHVEAASPTPAQAASRARVYEQFRNVYHKTDDLSFWDPLGSDLGDFLAEGEDAAQVSASAQQEAAMVDELLAEADPLRQDQPTMDQAKPNQTELVMMPPVSVEEALPESAPETSANPEPAVMGAVPTEVIEQSGPEVIEEAAPTYPGPALAASPEKPAEPDLAEPDLEEINSEAAPAGALDTSSDSEPAVESAVTPILAIVAHAEPRSEETRPTLTPVSEIAASPASAASEPATQEKSVGSINRRKVARSRRKQETSGRDRIAEDTRQNSRKKRQSTSRDQPQRHRPEGDRPAAIQQAGAAETAVRAKPAAQTTPTKQEPRTQPPVTAHAQPEQIVLRQTHAQPQRSIEPAQITSVAPPTAEVTAEIERLRKLAESIQHERDRILREILAVRRDHEQRRRQIIDATQKAHEHLRVGSF